MRSLHSDYLPCISQVQLTDNKKTRQIPGKCNKVVINVFTSLTRLSTEDYLEIT